MTPVRRAHWIIGLVLVHFFIVPCASAMMLMPAEADCEHCLTTDTQDACLLNSTTGSTSDNLLIDTGRADQPRLLQPVLFLMVFSARDLLATGKLPADFQSRFSASRASGDPPPYLLLGQLRL